MEVQLWQLSKRPRALSTRQDKGRPDCGYVSNIPMESYTLFQMHQELNKMFLLYYRVFTFIGCAVKHWIVIASATLSKIFKEMQGKMI